MGVFLDMVRLHYVGIFSGVTHLISLGYCLVRGTLIRSGWLTTSGSLRNFGVLEVGGALVSRGYLKLRWLVRLHWVSSKQLTHYPGKVLLFPVVHLPEMGVSLLMVH